MIRTNDWQVYWHNQPPGYITSVDFDMGTVTLDDGRTREIAGMTPVNRQHWPHVLRVINTWINHK